MMVAMEILFLLLHAPDGHEVRIKPEAIVTMHSKRETGETKMFAPGSNCLINLEDGKAAAVKEECDEIHKELEKQS